MKKSLIISFILFSLGLNAQHRLSLNGRAYESDSIRLRWAPSDPIMWNYCKEKGYQLERFTIQKSNQYLPAPELSDGRLIKTAAPEEWRLKGKGNQYAELAAQAMFGSSFKISGMAGQMTELDQRFSYALLAADLSSETANLSGLAWTDSNIRKDETYIYRLFCNGNAGELQMDSAWIRLSPQEKFQLPKPVSLIASASEQRIVLNWDQQSLSHVFSAYELYKAVDTGDFQLIMDQSNLLISGQPGQFIDSINTQNRIFKYKIRGISLFGDKGPFSEPISVVAGRHIIEEAPQITSHVAHKDSLKLFLNRDIINSCQTEAATSIKGPFIPILFSVINSKTIQISNEYNLAYIRCNCSETAGFPYYISGTDTLPPSPPIINKAEINNQGLQISWEASKESDIKGYRLYRSIHKNGRFSELSGLLISGTAYTDTTTYQYNGDTLYYQLLAEDRMYNQSGFSPVYSFVLPDKTPPSAPAILSAHSTEKGIKLEFPQPTVTKTIEWRLYRHADYESKWMLINPFAHISSTFTDSLVQDNHYYQYTLVAIDANGNESEPASPIGIHFRNQHKTVEIQHFTGKADRKNRLIKLEWEYAKEGATFRIYKAENNEPLRLYTTTNQRFIVDVELRIRQKYRYKVIADDQHQTESETLQIKY